MLNCAPTQLFSIWKGENVPGVIQIESEVGLTTRSFKDVCDFARFALRRRLKNVLNEDSLDDPKSPVAQATEIQSALRHIKYAAQETRDQNPSPDDVRLQQIVTICDEMSELVDIQVRSAGCMWQVNAETILVATYKRVSQCEEAD